MSNDNEDIVNGLFFFAWAVVTGICGWLVINHAGWFDRGFFMLGGLAVASAGLTIRHSGVFFGKSGTPVHEGFGWFGFGLMVVGIGLAIYSGTF